MARVLHLLKGADPGLAVETMARQRAAGDTVTVALLGDAAVTPPPGVGGRRVPGELTWEQLLEAIFEADQVIAW